MAKLKCEMCGNKFENFQAQGFNNKIYCPLCYFKKLSADLQVENFKLSNKLEKQRKEYQETYKDVRIEIKDYKKALNEIREICTALRGDNYPMSKTISDVVEIINKALGGNNFTKD